MAYSMVSTCPSGTRAWYKIFVKGTACAIPFDRALLEDKPSSRDHFLLEFPASPLPHIRKGITIESTRKRITFPKLEKFLVMPSR
jgi:hypothetical protein